MKDLLDKVNDFNKVFKVGGRPGDINFLSHKEYLLRYSLMNEENGEYLEACQDDDLVEIADALGDQLYILLGTINRHGLQDEIIEVFNEIHSSNMSKLEDGKPVIREDGKILKGKNYFEPKLKPILNGEGKRN